MAGLAAGRSTIRGSSPAADVASTAAAIDALGASVNKAQRDIETSEDSRSHRDFQIEVIGPGWDHLASPERPIDVGNSGTTIRLLAGILAGGPAAVTLTGDDSIRRRPMARVVEPLRAMGAHVTGADAGRRAPLTIEGAALTGIDHTLQIASAQVKSALLFAGLRASGTTSVAEPARSRDHTERMLRYVGVPVDESQGRLIVTSTDLPTASFTVPGDFSSAAFLLVAAAIVPGSDIAVRDVGVNPTRAGLLNILARFGAVVDLEDERDECGEPVATVLVKAGDRRPLEVRGDETVAAIDELPLVAILGAMAGGDTVIADAAELRVKESDRIEAMAAGLRAMGVEVDTTPDGMVVHGRGGRLAGARIDPGGDHRIAMAFAVAGLAAAEGETVVEGWDCVGVSYPGFERDLDAVVVR